jgi:hypothetical protein
MFFFFAGKAFHIFYGAASQPDNAEISEVVIVQTRFAATKEKDSESKE